ncbi:MAG: IS66 family transposase, partial [Thermoplasmata archaeon]
MAAAIPALGLAPEDESDEIVVSKKGLAELKRIADQAEARESENQRLREENAELRRRLSVHENPNVPPSVRNPAPGHSRPHPLTPPAGRKKPGAKPGHLGSTRENPPPDEKIVHTVERCRRCQSPRLKLIGKETTTEVELPPPPKPRVTEHTQHIYRCEECGEETRALPPDGREPSEWGPRLESEAVLGKIQDRLPYRKLRARLMRQGGKLLWTSTATLQGMVWRASEKLSGEEAAILQRLRAAPFVQVDESIMRVDGHREWLWVFVTEEDLLLVVRPSRSRDVVEEILGEEYSGKIICDGWKAYIGWVLQRCWAHLLRYGKEGAKESAEGQRLYAELCELHERLTQNLEEASLRTRMRRLKKGTRALEGLQRRYGVSEDAAVRKVMTYLTNGMPWWLTFLGTPGMEATNNRGERGLREAIVIRKIIGTLRNARGALAFTRLLSVLGTWGLRGEDVPTKLY